MYTRTLPNHIQLSAMRDADENHDAFDITVNGVVVKTIQLSTAQILGSVSEELVHFEANKKAVEWLIQNRYLEGPLRERPLTYKITCSCSQQNDDYGPSSFVTRQFEFEVDPGQDVHEYAAQEWSRIVKHSNRVSFIRLELVEKVDWTPDTPRQAAA